MITHTLDTFNEYMLGKGLTRKDEEILDILYTDKAKHIFLAGYIMDTYGYSFMFTVEKGMLDIALFFHDRLIGSKFRVMCYDDIEVFIKYMSNELTYFKITV